MASRVRQPQVTKELIINDICIALREKIQNPFVISCNQRSFALWMKIGPSSMLTQRLPPFWIKYEYDLRHDSSHAVKNNVDLRHGSLSLEVVLGVLQVHTMLG
jgi:hypothetical protein